MKVTNLQHMLYSARIRKGLTQKEASEELGIGRPYYSLLETGVRKNPRIGLAKKIAEFCGVEIKAIYGGK